MLGQDGRHLLPQKSPKNGGLMSVTVQVECTRHPEYTGELFPHGKAKRCGGCLVLYEHVLKLREVGDAVLVPLREPGIYLRVRRVPE